MTGSDFLSLQRSAWDEFDKRASVRRLAGRIDPKTKSGVKRELQRLTGRHRRRGEALSRLIGALDLYDLGTVDIIAPWQLDTPTGLHSFRLEQTAPTVAPITDTELVVTWEKVDGGYQIGFELT
jgi:hypothetical protein